MQLPNSLARRGLLAMIDADDKPRGLLALVDGDSGDALSTDDRIEMRAAPRRAVSEASPDPLLFALNRQISPAIALSSSGALGLAQTPTDVLLRQLLAHLPDAPMPSPAQTMRETTREAPAPEPGQTRFKYLDRLKSEEREPSMLEQYLVGSLRWLGVEPRRWLTGRAFNAVERPAVVTGPRG